MTTADGGALAGRTILVTRPQHQAGPIADLIARAGGHALIFPVIEIADIEDKRPLDAIVDRLDEFQWAIFVSPNAVEKALRHIAARRSVPSHLHFAAVGRSTVRALEKFGVQDIAAPARFDSEALLELPALQDVKGRRVVIFRGVGGRELLADALSARGAHVEYAECYRRVLPRIDVAPLLSQWQRGAIDAVTVTSSEGLQNFIALIGTEGRAHLERTPVFAPHARIARTARELGITTVVETAQGDDGLCEGLLRWFETH